VTEKQRPASRACRFAAFISHSSRDAVAAAEVCSLLESRGSLCWIAPRNVRPGSNYADEIVDGIAESSSVVVLISSNANLSHHIVREIEQAIRMGKPIFPVLIEKAPLSQTLDFYIAPIHWIDATAGIRPEHAEQLSSAIRGEESWKGNALAPSVRRRVRFNKRYLFGAGALIALVLAVSVASTYIAISRWKTREEQERKKSYVSWGFVSLAAESNSGDSASDRIRANIYLAAPGVTFSGVRLRVSGVRIDRHDDGDLTGELDANRLEYQVIRFGVQVPPGTSRIVTCLSVPDRFNPQAGARRVTQVFRAAEGKSGGYPILEFHEVSSATVRLEDGSRCDTQ